MITMFDHQLVLMWTRHMVIAVIAVCAEKMPSYFIKNRHIF